MVLRGYGSMAAELAGAQWNEGDVFCSVVRRVALPDAFFADRRADRDVPDGARRVRRLPGGDPARAGPLPAVPGHHQGADRRGARRRRPRDRARGDQGTRGRGRAGDAGAGRRSPTCWTGWPPTRDCRWTAPRWTRRWPTSRRSPGRRAHRSTRWSPRSTSWSAAIPEAAKYTLGCDPVTLAGAVGDRLHRSGQLRRRISARVCSRCIVARRRSTGTSRPSNTPDGEGFWSVATYAETLAVLRIR